MTWSYWDLGWPYLCLGGGLVLFVVMFSTNAMRSDLTVSRWRDPVWLAWLPAPMLMVHMFEEYGLDILGRTYTFPAALCHSLGFPPFPDCPIPTAHFWFLNLGAAWLCAPIAGWLARRNLIIGLSMYGLLIFNGLFHCVGVLAGGLAASPGALTGAVFFIPSFIWMVYAVLKSGVMSGKALAISVFGGIVMHILLLSILRVLSGISGGAVLIGDLVVFTSPFLIGWMGSKLVGSFPAKVSGAASV